MVEQVEAVMRAGPGRVRVGFYQDAWRRLRRNRWALVGLLIVAAFALSAIFAPYAAPHDPIEQDLDAQLLPPSREHLLGTDDLGRDLLSRIIYGGRVSLTVGIVSVGLALGAGTLLGLFAGYYGRWADSVTMRVMDVMLAFPATLLAIFIVGIRGPGLNNAMLATASSTSPSLPGSCVAQCCGSARRSSSRRPECWEAVRHGLSAATSCPTSSLRSSFRRRSASGPRSWRLPDCRSLDWGPRPPPRNGGRC